MKWVAVAFLVLTALLVAEPTLICALPPVGGGCEVLNVRVDHYWRLLLAGSLALVALAGLIAFDRGAET